MSGSHHVNRISSTPVEIVVTGGESSKRIDVFLANRDPTFSRLSHGESFLALLSTRRFRGPGLFVMDEPEAGLAFEAQLALLGQLIGLASRRGCQVLLATHSPIIAALPGATILQLDATGLHPTTWAQLQAVDHYRRFLAHPEQYLRHLD